MSQPPQQSPSASPQQTPSSYTRSRIDYSDFELNTLLLPAPTRTRRMAAVSDKGGRFKPESFRGSEGEDPEPYMDEFEAISRHNRYSIAERITILTICCKDRAKVFIKAHLNELIKTDPTKADYA